MSYRRTWLICWHWHVVLSKYTDKQLLNGFHRDWVCHGLLLYNLMVLSNIEPCTHEMPVKFSSLLSSCGPEGPILSDYRPDLLQTFLKTKHRQFFSLKYLLDLFYFADSWRKKKPWVSNNSHGNSPSSINRCWFYWAGLIG